MVSSNYELYGDMSERVMTVIESMVPSSEVCSIATRLSLSSPACPVSLSALAGRSARRFTDAQVFRWVSKSPRPRRWRNL